MRRPFRPQNSFALFNLVLVVAASALLLPTLRAQSTPSGSTNISLTDLPIGKNKESDNLQDTLFVDKTKDGAPLKLGDRTYPHGLSVLRTATTWNYALDGKYSGLAGEIGQTGGVSVVRFFGDGKLIHEITALPKDSSMPFFVDLRGVKDLKIVSIDPVSTITFNTSLIIGNPRLMLRPVPDSVDSPGSSQGNKPPKAVIKAEPLEGEVPLEVSFKGDQSTDADGAIGRYTWHFGDGGTETLSPNPKHTFTEPGLYEVVLLAEDSKGGVGVTRQLVTVRPTLNQPPVIAVKTSARTTSSGKAVQFDASESRDVDGSISEYQWDFGDGKKATGPKVEHTFSDLGRFNVALTVTDNKGGQSKQTVSVKVVAPSQIAKPFPLQKDARILIIGNSLVSFCRPMREWLKTFDEISPEPLNITVDDVGKGMGKLVEYATWDSLGVKAKIDLGWDVVIIQPWADALDPKVSDEEFLNQAKTLVEWIRASGAYPVFYEPQVSWSKIKTEQPLNHRRVSMLADKLDTGLIPAGEAWLRVEKERPLKVDAEGVGTQSEDPLSLSNFMYIDGGHQSFSGSLFNALMVWKYLTGRSPKDVLVTAETPGVAPEHLKQVHWDQVPFLKGIANESITPGSERTR